MTIVFLFISDSSVDAGSMKASVILALLAAGIDNVIYEFIYNKIFLIFLNIQSNPNKYIYNNTPKCSIIQIPEFFEYPKPVSLNQV